MNLWARCAKRYSGPAKTSQNVRFRFERPRGTVKNSLIVSIDPGGRILVAAGVVDMSVRSPFLLQYQGRSLSGLP
jgi:hypothetical protein